MPTFRAARMEQKIWKVPKSEAVAALGQSKLGFASASADLEKYLAVEEEGKKLVPWKTVFPTHLSDLLRDSKQGDDGRDLRIANPEQRGGSRRFEDHLAATPSHVREPRQDESVGSAELRCLRPIIGNLRLDDDQILGAARTPEAVFQ
ncbi:MAG: hypothetical protein WA397_15455 [Roseiarcus sp.]